MAAGGYEDEQWWDTEAGRRWQRGERDQTEEKQFYRDLQRDAKDDFEETLRRCPNATEEDREWLTNIAQLEEGELEEILDDWYPMRTLREPGYWVDVRYNNPAQPVVGICWYEAQAYCRWLAAQTDPAFLPTEAEWEVAARGRERRVYVWGNELDPRRCNSYETHVRTTTPIGVFPGGDTPSADPLVDMTGNTWDWTSTRYRPDYRDRSEDWEDPETPGWRVVRGGSFDDGRAALRGAYRDRFRPTDRNNALGLRVCCGSSHMSSFPLRTRASRPVAGPSAAR